MSTPNPPPSTGYTGDDKTLDTQQQDTQQQTTQQEAKDRAAVVKDDAKDRAANVGGHAADQGKELKDEALEEVKGVADEAKAHLKDVSSTAQSQFKEQAEQQATRAGSGLSDIGRQMQDIADGSDEQGVVPDLLGALGGQVSKLADTLQGGNFDDVMDDLKGFARRRPGVFLLGAALAGFASTRVARLADLNPSSGSDDHRSQPTARLTSYDSHSSPAKMADSSLPAAPLPSQPATATPPVTGSPRTGVAPPERPTGGAV